MSQPAAFADGLPVWAVVSPRRQAHIERVVALIRHWTVACGLSQDEAVRWVRAAWLHDALRDAPSTELQRWAPGMSGPAELLHGPAAAARAQHEGERDADVLEAVRWHSTGYAGWGRAGRALYCADFLEPGRPFDQAIRAQLAERFCDDADAVLCEVIARRFAWAEKNGWPIAATSAEFRRVTCG